MEHKKEVEEREVDADRDVGRGGDKNGSFCFYKHNDRQEQPQQNNLPDKNHKKHARGEKRRGELRTGKERRKPNRTLNDGRL